MPNAKCKVQNEARPQTDARRSGILSLPFFIFHSSFFIFQFVCLANAVSAEPPESDLPNKDQQLLDDIPPPDSTAKPAGEDLGSPGEEDPINGILAQMEASRQRLQQGDTSQSTVELQRKIADDLAELIARMRRQQPRSSPSQSQASSGANQSQNVGNPSDHPPRDGDTTADVAPPEAPVGRAIWGHLPKKVRQQINDSAIDEFLPSFEEMIEAYYRRLATEPEKMQRQNQ